MCGITGLICQHSAGLTSSQAEQFEHLLVINSFRGYDSTGVIEVNNKGGAQTYKDVGNPFNVLLTEAWAKIRSDSIREGRFLFGHGRKATFGTISVANAHPFVVKDIDKNTGEVKSHIILIHNGTLDRTNADMYKFDVDSHFLADMIATRGAREAFSTIRGAIATMWYDVLTKKLHIFRNDERPLFWVQNKEDQTVFINSEPSPLMYISLKHHIKFTEKPILFEAHTLYTINVDLKNKRGGGIWSTESITQPKKFVPFKFDRPFSGVTHYDEPETKVTYLPTNGGNIITAPRFQEQRVEAGGLPDRPRFHSSIDIHNAPHFERSRLYELMRRIQKGEILRVRWSEGKEFWDYPEDGGKIPPPTCINDRYPAVAGMVSMNKQGNNGQIEIRFVRNGKVDCVYTRPPQDLPSLLAVVPEAENTAIPAAMKEAPIPQATPIVRPKSLTKSEIKEAARQLYAMNGTVPKGGQINRWHGKSIMYDDKGKEFISPLTNYAKSELNNPFFFQAYGNQLDGFFYIKQRILVSIDFMTKGSESSSGDTNCKYWCSLVSQEPTSTLLGIQFLSSLNKFNKAEEVVGEIICIRAATKEENEREGFSVVIYLGRLDLAKNYTDGAVSDLKKLPGSIKDIQEAIELYQIKATQNAA